MKWIGITHATIYLKPLRIFWPKPRNVKNAKKRGLAGLLCVSVCHAAMLAAVIRHLEDMQPNILLRQTIP
jgi:hypothetical protein